MRVSGRVMVQVPVTTMMKRVPLMIPRMVAVPGMDIKIMPKELTVGYFRQFVEASGYKIEGHNAGSLIAALKGDSKAPLTYLSLLDARAYAEWLSKQTGRNFRVQTEDEFLQARGLLSGNNWTWTETLYQAGGSAFVLRLLGLGSRDNSDPEIRFNCDAARLVEDLK